MDAQRFTHRPVRRHHEELVVSVHPNGDLMIKLTGAVEWQVWLDEDSADFLVESIIAARFALIGG